MLLSTCKVLSNIYVREGSCVFLLSVFAGVVDLHVDDECEELGQEPEEGNMEYKLKLVNPSMERLEHLVIIHCHRICTFYLI